MLQRLKTAGIGARRALFAGALVTAVVMTNAGTGDASAASGFAVSDPGVGAELYRVDATHGTLTTVATLHTGSVASLPMSDIAIDTHGRLYGSTFSALYRIDPATALATKVADFPQHDINGLAFDRRNGLYASTLSGRVVRVFSNGRFRRVATIHGQSSGDILFINSTTLIETVVGPTGDVLYRVNVRSGRAHRVGSTHLPRIYGLFASGTRAHGVTSRDAHCPHGSLVRVNVHTGRVSARTCLEADFGGAAAPYHRVR